MPESVNNNKLISLAISYSSVQSVRLGIYASWSTLFG